MDESRKNIHLLIADDHTLFRETLKRVLDSEKGFLVVGEAGDSEETLKLVRLLQPDILLLDWNLPRLSGLDLLQSLSTLVTRMRIILLTANIEQDQIPHAFHLGARGLMMKESGVDLLIESMRCVMAGQYWLCGEGCKSLEQIMNKLPKSAPEIRQAPKFTLTQQELRVVVAVASGITNKEIAQQLSISVQTVKHHITNIFDKLGVYNRLELTLFALHHKLIEDSD
jgi:two-component system nitrate/nitrite response regulator NarL